MEQESFGYLTPEQQKNYTELEKVFTSPGWALLAEFLKLEAEGQLDRLIAAKDWDTNRLATGARAAYTHIANLQEITELQFTQLADSNREQLDQDDLDFE